MIKSTSIVSFDRSADLISPWETTSLIMLMWYSDRKYLCHESFNGLPWSLFEPRVSSLTTKLKRNSNKCNGCLFSSIFPLKAQLAVTKIWTLFWEHVRSIFFPFLETIIFGTLKNDYALL